MLIDDSRRLAERLQSAGSHVEIQVYRDRSMCIPGYVRFFPEAETRFVDGTSARNCRG